MLFLVIEHVKDQDVKAAYRRFKERGRMIPKGLTYINSWVEVSFDRIFQLMECDDLRLLQAWALEWNDLVEFEIVPVVGSKDVVEMIMPKL
jgi:hypothetical protein